MSTSKDLVLFNFLNLGDKESILSLLKNNHYDLDAEDLILIIEWAKSTDNPDNVIIAIYDYISEKISEYKFPDSPPYTISELLDIIDKIDSDELDEVYLDIYYRVLHDLLLIYLKHEKIKPSLIDDIFNLTRTPCFFKILSLISLNHRVNIDKVHILGVKGFIENNLGYYAIFENENDSSIWDHACFYGSGTSVRRLLSEHILSTLTYLLSSRKVPSSETVDKLYTLLDSYPDQSERLIELFESYGLYPKDINGYVEQILGIHNPEPQLIKILANFLEGKSSPYPLSERVTEYNLYKVLIYAVENNLEEILRIFLNKGITVKEYLEIYNKYSYSGRMNEKVESIFEEYIEKQRLLSRLKNCNNDFDPVSQTSFNEMSINELERIVRLESGNCYEVEGLEGHLISRNNDRLKLTDPLNPSYKITDNDLREIRRVDKDFILESKPFSYPPGYEFRVEQGTVNDVDFYEIIVKVEGEEYELGIIPVDIGYDVSGSTDCTSSTLVQKIQRLWELGRLFTPNGFTVNISYTPDEWLIDTGRKIRSLCRLVDDLL